MLRDRKSYDRGIIKDAAMHSNHKITVLAAKALMALMAGGLALSAFVLATPDSHASPITSAALSQPCPSDTCEGPGVPHTAADDPVPYVPPKTPVPHIGSGSTGAGAGRDQTHS
jgi:hypothetical protein